jgi:flagellar basal-body rod protein FlgB
MDALLGPAAPVLEGAMRYRVSREAVLAGNIANVDTPGFRRRDLSFDGLLGEALSSIERTHPGHLPSVGSDPSRAYRVELGPRGTRPDGNGVDLDQELVLAQRNASSFTHMAQVLARLSSLVRTAMGSGGA